MYKNIFSFLILSALVAMPALASAQFPDVYGTDPNYSAIEYVQNKGIVEGYPNGNYEPDVSINRAEFVKILVKTKYSESDILACKKASFSDVPSDVWFAPYVCIAKKNHIVDGYPDKTFQPDNPISFVEAAKILRNTLLSDESLVESPSFTQWYEPYVNALSLKRAIPVSINGFDALITRGEMAHMIYRLDAKLDMLPSLSIWEINDRKLIEKYYENISAGNLDLAYSMKSHPEMSLDSFKALYKDFPNASITQFSKTAAHTFEFTVMTFPRLEANRANARSERYEVAMTVQDGKIETVSSEKVAHQLLEEATNGTINAALEWENGVYVVSFYKAGETKATVAQQYDTVNGISTTIKNLAVSPNGKYLTYQIRDWEYTGVEVFEMASQKSESYMGVNVYGFTPDDSHFYFCSVSGMSSGELFVLNLPGLDNKHLLFDEGKDVINYCGPFDKATNTLHYELMNTAGQTTKGSYVMQ